jgi:hypothetical protein
MNAMQRPNRGLASFQRIALARGSADTRLWIYRGTIFAGCHLGPGTKSRLLTGLLLSIRKGGGFFHILESHRAEDAQQTAETSFVQLERWRDGCRLVIAGSAKQYPGTCDSARARGTINLFA